MNKIRRNIKIDYIYRFFASFDITSGIWVLYLAHKGMSLAQIGLLESIFHMTGVITEIPSGAVADLIGRKRVLVLGRIMSLVSAVVMLFSNTFIGFAIGFVLSAWGYNFNSGSEEALVYDTLKEIEREDEYLRVNSKLNLIIEIAQGLAVFIGGLLAEQNFTLSYTVAILVSITALGISLNFTETTLIEKGENKGLIKHFKECIDVLKTNRRLISILVYFPLVLTFSSIVYFYGQQYLFNMGYSKSNIALIFLVNGGFSALGSLSSERLEKITNNKLWIYNSFFITIDILIFGFGTGKLSIASFWILGYLTAMMYPISSNKINRLVESKQRATIISIESMFFSIMMIIFFPICGILGDMISLKYSFILIGILSLIIVSVAVFHYRNKKI